MRLLELEARQDCPFGKDVSTAWIVWTQMKARLIEVYDQENLSIYLRRKLACVWGHFPHWFLFHLNDSIHHKLTE